MRENVNSQMHTLYCTRIYDTDRREADPSARVKIASIRNSCYDSYITCRFQARSTALCAFLHGSAMADVQGHHISG